MPSGLLPDDLPEISPLSSKSHWDVPVLLSDSLRVHVLASHPTPPISRGAEVNPRRNHDEIRFWADYTVADLSSYVRDDQGVAGGLAAGAPFVIMGDLNADPVDGDSHPGAIAQLLEHPRIQGDVAPRSEGAVEQQRLQWQANSTQRGDASVDTADFNDASGPGNLRVDYVLPSVDLRVEGSGVFWPLQGDPLFTPVGVHPFPGSDHRLVWVDIRVE